MMQGIKIIGATCVLAMLIAGCNSTEQTLQPIPGESASLTNTDNTAPVDAFPRWRKPQAPGTIPRDRSARIGNVDAGLPARTVRCAGRIRFTPVIGAPVNRGHSAVTATRRGRRAIAAWPF